MHTTAREVQEKKGHEPILLLSAHDSISARWADEAGADLVLVGDSVGIEVLGLGSVLPVTTDDLLHHLQAVSRGSHHALIVADMPFGAYGISARQTVDQAIHFVKRGGAHAVKMAGGSRLVPEVRQLREQGIPVLGHIGVSSSDASLGEAPRVAGCSDAEAQCLLEDAMALETAGCFALIAKCIEVNVARAITARCRIPVISIGSGACDGVGANIIDLVGFASRRDSQAAWFSMRCVDGNSIVGHALAQFASGVRTGTLVSPGQDTGHQ